MFVDDLAIEETLCALRTAVADLSTWNSHIPAICFLSCHSEHYRDIYEYQNLPSFAVAADLPLTLKSVSFT